MRWFRKALSPPRSLVSGYRAGAARIQRGRNRPQPQQRRGLPAVGHTLGSDAVDPPGKPIVENYGYACTDDGGDGKLVQMGRLTTRRAAKHLSADNAVRRPETLAVEEPLEIRVNGAPLTVTMRTPGADVELAQGFLLTEGIVGHRDDLVTVRYCSGTGADGANTYNVLDVALAPDVPAPDVDVTRNFYTTSSCGVCGKASLEAVRLVSRYRPASQPASISASTLTALPCQLRSAQKVFASTGGLHAAALFDLDGAMLVVREDIGRHNAVDKVIGWALENDRIPLNASVLLVSGRASFELTQKAVMAGIPLLAAVSAPSSLAVDLAEQAGVTLVAFLRGDSMNIYSRPDRVIARPRIAADPNG